MTFDAVISVCARRSVKGEVIWWDCRCILMSLPRCRAQAPCLRLAYSEPQTQLSQSPPAAGRGLSDKVVPMDLVAAHQQRVLPQWHTGAHDPHELHLPVPDDSHHPERARHGF